MTYIYMIINQSIFTGHMDVVALLLDKGAEIGSRDDVNWTPLDHAAFEGHYKTTK